MNTIIERITEAIKDILIGLIKSCLDNMFTSVNEQVGTIAGQVGQTPQGWNAGIFNLIQNISQTVIVPIAGLIITFVLCYELITMVTQKNNFHEFETYNIFLWIFKAYVAIYLVTNTFNITMAVFDVGQHVVNNAAGVISGNTAVDASEAITRIVDALEDMELGDLFLLSMETLLISITMRILSIIITVILYGRMIEIYLYTSIAPIPFATMTNKEWGNIGNNYLKGLFALAFQGFFMMVCVGIYAVLVNAMTISSDLHNGLTYEEVMNGHSKIRNKGIANIFSQMGLVEAWGSGIKRILNAAEEYGLLKPRFQEFDNMFRVELFRNSFPMTNEKENIRETSEKHRRSIGEASEVVWRTDLNDTQQKIIKLLSEDHQLSAVKLAEKIGVASRNIENNIKKLKEYGILIRHGSPKNGYWEIVDKDLQE